MSLFKVDEPSPPSIRDLLCVEDDPAVPRIVCPTTAIPLWSQGRTVFLRFIIADLFYQSAMPGRLDQSAGRVQAARTLARSIAGNMRTLASGRARRPILIKGDAVSDRWDGAAWRNPLADAFGEATPGSATMLYDHYEWRWPFPRRNDTMALFMAPFQTRHAIIGAIKADSHHYELAGNLVEIVADRAAKALGWEIGAKRREWLIRYLARKAAALPYKYRDYGALFDRLGTRLLLLSEGCYGQHAAMIRAARDRGILTAEYAHGAITEGHDAYNFASSVRMNAGYRQTLPDALLSYGRWWETQTNAPVEMVTIGNPARSVAPDPEDAAGRRDVLILSDGIDFPEYLELARYVRGRADAIGLRTVLRPHPIEREPVRQQYGGSIDGISLEADGTIFDAFKTAKVVVSEVSTGLFDAHGLVDHIWVLTTPKSKFTMPRHPFQAIENLNELDRCLAGLATAMPEPSDSASIWEPEWKWNYLQFLSDRQILKQAG
jgi:hypothetical protein